MDWHRQTHGHRIPVRRKEDGQGLCSPGDWAPADRRYPSSQLWASISRLFLLTAESRSTLQLLSELALGRLAKAPFGQEEEKVAHPGAERTGRCG